MLDRPLRFQPILMPRLWGGRRLRALFPARGRVAPGPIGEAWLLSDRPEAPSRVAGGPQGGRTLAELRSAEAPSLLGRAAVARGAAGQRFPILLKIIDAAQTLSVQVHPPDVYARVHEREPQGKMEAWVILATVKRARVVRGFSPGVTRDEVARRLSDERLEELLHSVRVRKDDAVWIPPGTVHTIGAGICLAEVQQNSDVTYRLFDWNRIDANGRRRELHVDRAFSVLSFRRSGPDLVAPRSLAAVGFTRELLVDCPRFRLERRSWRGTAFFRTHGGAVVVMATRGRVTLITGRPPSHQCALRPWETALVPACVGPFSAHAPRGATLLWAIPKWG